ncbi:MAG: hypothetical protein EOM30_04525 [Clostridia bacterium]|nr:hypothetical protein [Clostridia bacterium]
MTKETLKKYMDPIADGLFGKQRVKRYEKPQFVVRPLAMMMEDLAAISDEAWCRYSFSNEPLNGKLNDEQRERYGAQFRECGKEYAQKLMREMDTDSPVIMARNFKMDISYPQYPEKTDRVLFAEFREPKSIRIYMDAVNRAKKLLVDDEVQRILTNRLDVSNLLLAHELFHFVEEKYKAEIPTRTEKIELWHIGAFRNRSSVIAFSEIAAMSFAKEITGIPYSPYLMDVFLVYGYSPQEASGLYETMMEYAGLTPRLPADT